MQTSSSSSLNVPQIKPHLIIYYPNKYSTVFNKAIKYGLSPHKLNYSDEMPKNKRLQLFLRSATKRTLPQLLYIVDNKPSPIHHLLQFLSQISHLNQERVKHLSLIFTEFPSPPKTINLLFRKLFRKAKHITSLNLDISSQIKLIPLSLKTISLSRHIKSLTLSATSETPSDHLFAHLTQAFRWLYRRKTLPRLQNQRFYFDLPILPLNSTEQYNQLLDFDDLMTNKITTFSFNFSFLFIDLNILDLLGKKFAQIQNPFYLTSHGWFNPDLSGLLNPLFKSPALNGLVFDLPNRSHALHNTLKAFSEISFCANSLQYLKVSLTDVKDKNELNGFMKRLMVLTQLSTLKIDFVRENKISDETLSVLAQSLNNLGQLTSFDLGCNKQYDHSKVSQTGLHRVFEALKNLKNLRELTLRVNNYEKIITDISAAILWRSLRSLVNLKLLSLDLASNKVGNKAMSQLEKALANLKDLDTLRINVENCEWMTSRAVKVLFERLKEMGSLMSLVVKIGCKRVDHSLVVVLTEILYSFERLESLEIYLNRGPGAHDEDIQMLIDAISQVRRKTSLKLVSSLAP